MGHMMDREELVKRCIDRDHAAWKEFIRRYETLLIKSVRYKLKKLNTDAPRDEFRDIVQEIFLEIWEKNKLSRIRDITCLENWLILFSLNMTSNYCRRWIFREARTHVSFEQNLSWEDPDLTLGSFIPCDRSDGRKVPESREVREVLAGELDKLGCREQIALKLNLYDRKKHKDIASIMNVPQNTVSTLIKRAKNQVREGMERYFEKDKER